MADVKRVKVDGGAGQLGFIFFMCYVGAAYYFISTSSGAFLDVVWSLIKAIVWPAFLVFHAMSGLGI